MVYDWNFEEPNEEATQVVGRSFWIGFQKLQLDRSLFLWMGDQVGFRTWVSLFLVHQKQPRMIEM
jgi:hypothetical protein